MNQSHSSILKTLTPFIMLGIVIAISVAVLIFLAYVVVWGLLIGVIIWIVVAIKNKFFPTRETVRKHGITIDYKDIK